MQPIQEYPSPRLPPHWPTGLRARLVQGRGHHSSVVTDRATAVVTPPVAQAATWPLQQVWAHPDEHAFDSRIGEVSGLVLTRVAMLPLRLTAGPLGCGTSRHVMEFRGWGQADRAWRLAARLILLGAGSDEACQETLDLCISAYLLAVHEGGCVIAAIEGAAAIDRLLDAAETMPLHYPGCPLQGAALVAHLRRRRTLLLDRTVAAAATAPGSPASIEALMRRAPLLPRHPG